MHELNLMYCELASLLMLYEQLPTRVEPSATLQSNGIMSDAAFLLQLVQISNWIAKALAGQVCIYIYNRVKC